LKLSKLTVQYLITLGLGAVTLSGCGGGGSTGTSVSPSRYSLVDIGTLPTGTDTQPIAINDAGVAVGYGNTTSVTTGYHPFVYSPLTGITEIIPPGGKSASAVASGVNSQGEIVHTNLTGTMSCFLTNATGNPTVSLSINPSYQISSATGLTDAGLVVGFETGAPAGTTGFEYSTSTGLTENLGQLAAGQSSVALASSVNGYIAGRSAVVSGAFHGFILAPGSATPTDVDPNSTYGSSRNNAINSRGDTAGALQQTTSVATHAFVYTAATGITPVPELAGATESWLMGINLADRAVGYCTVNGVTTGVVYSASQGMQDLNSLVFRAAGWRIIRAVAINNNGWILAAATQDSVHNHAVILKPL